MIKYMKLAIFSWFLFIAASIALGGGDKFRELGEQAGFTFQSAIDILSNKADSLKAEADDLTARIKEWAGIKEKDKDQA